MIEQVLRGVVLEDLGGRWGDWHTRLGHVEFALNSAVSASSGVSPFELVYGQPVAEPVDRLDGQHRVESAQEIVTRVAALVERVRGALARA